MRIDHRGAKITALILFAFACVATFAVLYKAAGGILRVNTPYTIKTVVPTAFQLVANGDVRRAGVKIGVVRDVTNRGDNGLVTIEITDEDSVPMFRDGTVQLRTKTLVGENYLAITQGTPQAGKVPDGGTLPLEQAREAVQLDEILATFDEPTRREVRRNLDGLGPGLDGRGDELNDLFGAMRPTVSDGGRVASILRRQKEQLAAVVDDTATVMSAFGERTEQVRTLARQARVTAEAVAARDERFGEAIDELGPTLRQAGSSVSRLGSFSGRAAPAMRDLRLASEDLRPLMPDLRAAAREGRTLFREVPPLSKELDPMLVELRGFSQALRPAVGSLDGFLRQMNPALRYFAPYSREFGAFFGNIGTVNGIRDSVGSIGRVHLMLSPSSNKGSGSRAEGKAMQALIEAGGLGRLRNEVQNAYPRPGTVDRPEKTSNFRRVEPDGK